MIDMNTAVADLKLLSDEDLTRLQLMVNGERSVRVQSERLAKRLETTFVEAQAHGFTDEDLAAAVDAAKVKSRSGKVDPASKFPRAEIPAVLGKPFRDSFEGSGSTVRSTPIASDGKTV